MRSTYWYLDLFCLMQDLLRVLQTSLRKQVLHGSSCIISKLTITCYIVLKHAIIFHDWMFSKRNTADSKYFFTCIEDKDFISGLEIQIFKFMHKYIDTNKINYKLKLQSLCFYVYWSIYARTILLLVIYIYMYFKSWLFRFV